MSNAYKDLGTFFPPDTHEPSWFVFHACERCGAVVIGESIDQHDRWHASLDATH